MGLFIASMWRGFILVVTSFFLLFNAACAKTIDYTPTESNEILVNPDIGIVDHQTINIKDNPDWNVPSYPETSVVYFRWYWEELEPEQGQYNFQLIDDTIEKAARLNKKIVIRFMTLAGNGETYYPDSPRAYKKILGIPCWLKKQLDPNTSDVCEDDNSFAIDYHDPIFQSQLERFIQVMGNRYNSNPNILRLDFGLVGTWGEWHLYSHSTENASTLGQNNYTSSDLKIYLDMMKRAFPDQMLSIDLGTVYDDFSGMATSQGYGWRADCIGNWDSGWNHMEDAYPQTLAHIANTSDPLILSRWKKAPVDFEICYTMAEWAQQPEVYTQEKVQETFDTALALHASLFNLKSGEIPAIYQDELNAFIKKLGYRFVIKHVQVKGNLTPGGRVSISSQWANVGVAPSYNNYPVTWRLVNSKGNKAVAYFYTSNDITHWLPADDVNSEAEIYTLTDDIVLPSDLKSGRYSLEVGLVKKGTNNAVISLAINEQANEQWYKLINLNIK